MKLTKMKKQITYLGAAVVLAMCMVQPVCATPGDDYAALAAQAQEQLKQSETEQQKLQKEYNAALKKLQGAVKQSKTDLDSLADHTRLDYDHASYNFWYYLDQNGLYDETTRGYYTGELNHRNVGESLDEEFIQSVREKLEGEDGIETLVRRLVSLRQKAVDAGLDLDAKGVGAKGLRSWIEEAGMTSVERDSRTAYYPAKIWKKIVGELGSGRVHNLNDIAKLYDLVDEDSGVTKVGKTGDIVRFVKDGVTYTYNCETHRLTRISGSEKIKETASKSGGVFWNILKGTMLTLATGAEIYRPFLTAKTNERFLDGWENTALRSLDYGFPIPPYPVLQPIYPVNLTGIFKLWGMGDEQSSYDRSMAWFNQSPFMQAQAMSMNPMAMNMAMQMQMRQQMMNPWGGGQGQGGPWGQQQSPWGGNGGQGGINVDWNQLLAPLQYQTFAMSNWMNRVNEEIVVKRQQAENSINNLRALEAATGQYQRIIPELMGVLNKLGTAQGQLNSANNRTVNGMSNMDYSVQYRRDGGQFSGGFGGGSGPQNPYVQQGW